MAKSLAQFDLLIISRVLIFPQELPTLQCCLHLATRVDTELDNRSADSAHCRC